MTNHTAKHKIPTHINTKVHREFSATTASFSSSTRAYQAQRPYSFGKVHPKTIYNLAERLQRKHRATYKSIQR